MRTALLVLLAVAAVAATVDARHPTPALTNATFADAHGVHAATFQIDGVCSGPATATLTVHDWRHAETRTVPVWIDAAPDPCMIACAFQQCVVPFEWAITGPGIVLGGGGTVGFVSSWAAEGRFQEGALAARASGFDVVCPAYACCPPLATSVACCPWWCCAIEPCCPPWQVCHAERIVSP